MTNEDLIKAAEFLRNEAIYSEKTIGDDRSWLQKRRDEVGLACAEHVLSTISNDDKDTKSASDEPIHEWFELSYSSYLVLPRSILQSAPVWWQREFVALIELLGKAVGPVPDCYMVQLRDPKSKRIIRDEYADYERGRRIVPMKEMPTP